MQIRCDNHSYYSCYWHTAKCGDPLDGLPTHAANSIQILGYVNPALQGLNVTVSCRSRLPLNGSNSATLTCLDSGQWEPDPRGIECDSECE